MRATVCEFAPSCAHTIVVGLSRDEFITAERDDYLGTPCLSLTLVRRTDSAFARSLAVAPLGLNSTANTAA